MRCNRTSVLKAVVSFCAGMVVVLVLSHLQLSNSDAHFIARSEERVLLSKSMDKVTPFRNRLLTSTSLSRDTTTLTDANNQWKDVLIRSVYFDDRDFKDGHNYSSVFLIHMRTGIWEHNLIIACGIGTHYTTNFTLQVFGTSRAKVFAHVSLNTTHDDVMVKCHDLPGNDGDRAFIVYQRHKNAEQMIKVFSEQDYVIPPPARDFSNANFRMVACTIAFNEPPWLIDWVHYQRTIGVDHVHFIAEADTFYNSSAYNDPEFQEEIRSGFVTSTSWPKHFNESEIHYHGQVLANNDCIYRFRNSYEYLYLFDTDDFFNPRIPGITDIKRYIRYFCPGAWCAFEWILHFPDCGLSQRPADGNLTRALIDTSTSPHRFLKALYRISDAVDVGTHVPAKLLPGNEKGRNVIDTQFAYVAHMRIKRKPKNKCNKTSHYTKQEQ